MEQKSWNTCPNWSLGHLNTWDFRIQGYQAWGHPFSISPASCRPSSPLWLPQRVAASEAIPYGHCAAWLMPSASDQHLDLLVAGDIREAWNGVEGEGLGPLYP